MKLIAEPTIPFYVNTEVSASEAIVLGGFKYHEHDYMFRSAVCESAGSGMFTMATYKLDEGTIEQPLERFMEECRGAGYIPANLWHLCFLAHYKPCMHRRIIIAPGTTVEDEGVLYMPAIHGLNRNAPCISQIKTEIMPTGLGDEEFALTSSYTKGRELLAVKLVV